MNKQAYTLSEILIVVVLVGIISALAIPQYFTIIERSRLDEGKQMLYAAYAAQKRYFADHQKYAANSTEAGFEYVRPKYFETASVSEIYTAATTTTFTATIDRNTLDISSPFSSGYRLSIDQTGTISCSTVAVCSKLGF